MNAEYKELQDYFDQRNDILNKINCIIEQMNNFVNFSFYKEWWETLTIFEQYVFLVYTKININEMYAVPIYSELESLRSLIDKEVIIGSVCGDDYIKYPQLSHIEHDTFKDKLSELVFTIDESYTESLFVNSLKIVHSLAVKQYDSESHTGTAPDVQNFFALCTIAEFLELIQGEKNDK